MNNDNDLNLHSMTKLSGWLRYCPLVYGGSSTSATDMSVLTPNHFLHGRASLNLKLGKFESKICLYDVDEDIVNF